MTDFYKLFIHLVTLDGEQFFKAEHVKGDGKKNGLCVLSDHATDRWCQDILSDDVSQIANALSAKI